MKLPVPVRAVFGLELRSLLRDPRTVLISVVLPLFLIPFLLLAGNWVEDRRADREDARVYRVAVTGADSAFAASLIEGVVGGTNGAERERFRLVEVDDPQRALQTEALDIHVEALSWMEWRALVAEGEVTRRDRAGPEFDGAPVLRLRFHSSHTGSRDGVEVLRERLLELRASRRDALLSEAGFPVPMEQVAIVDARNVASQEQIQGARLGRFLTLVLLGLMILGGSAISIDTLAGEKERGTLTTLLTSAASRTEIVTGKLLAIMAVALAIALVQILNLWLFLGLGLVEPMAGFAVSISPGLAAGLFVLYLPAVALTAGVLLLSSAHAHSYKEAQFYLTPVLALLLVPALAPLLPGITLQSAILAVPLANLSVGAHELLTGQAYLPGLIVAWLVTAVGAAWVTDRSIHALHDEGLITGDTSRAEFFGGPELFQKRVLRWFAAFWAVKILLEFNLPIDDVRTAVLVNVGLVFLVFPFVVIRHFRLDPVEALALRVPRPGVWLGVLIGAPAGLVTANTIFRLMDFVVPVPTELLENLGQAVTPEGIPMWQLVILLSVVPGITEELTFRGVLLHGLRKRFRPVALALVVGLIFGFFHFQIFRIPQSAAIGVMLTVVTLYSGSIFPAIVWHTLNNALAVYLGSEGMESVLESWWWSAGAVLALVLAFRIIWVFRTPYPDVGLSPGPARAEPSDVTARPPSGAAR